MKKLFLTFAIVLICLVPHSLQAQGPRLPFTLQDACEGESCGSGNGRNCRLPSDDDVMKVYASPRLQSKILFKLKSADRDKVKILKKTIVVQKPYAYRLTQMDIEKGLCRSNGMKTNLTASDIVYVLAYSSEGSYRAWFHKQLLSCDPRVLEPDLLSDTFESAQRAPWCKVRFKDREGWITNAPSAKYL